MKDLLKQTVEAVSGHLLRLTQLRNLLLEELHEGTQPLVPPLNPLDPPRAQDAEPNLAPPRDDPRRPAVGATLPAEHNDAAVLHTFLLRTGPCAPSQTWRDTGLSEYQSRNAMERLIATGRARSSGKTSNRRWEAVGQDAETRRRGDAEKSPVTPAAPPRKTARRGAGRQETALQQVRRVLPGLAEPFTSNDIMRALHPRAPVGQRREQIQINIATALMELREEQAVTVVGKRGHAKEYRRAVTGEGTETRCRADEGKSYATPNMSEKEKAYAEFRGQIHVPRELEPEA